MVNLPTRLPQLIGIKGVDDVSDDEEEDDSKANVRDIRDRNMLRASRRAANIEKVGGGITKMANGPLLKGERVLMFDDKMRSYPDGRYGRIDVHKVSEPHFSSLASNALKCKWRVLDRL